MHHHDEMNHIGASSGIASAAIATNGTVSGEDVAEKNAQISAELAQAIGNGAPLTLGDLKRDNVGSCCDTPFHLSPLIAYYN